MAVSVGAYYQATDGALAAQSRLFTAPSFLFANPVNCELSVILVDIINSMLQYQLDGAACRTLH